MSNNANSSLEGAALIGFHLLTPFLRRYREHWGAADAELARSLPGDEFVAHPRWQYTHAITIHTPASEVWSWLIQLGAGRGGFYSYEGLENLVGCDLHNADEIIPRFQSLKPGDEIKLHPKAPGMKVEVVEQDRYVLIHNNNHREGSRSYIHTTWLWYLDSIDPTTTRLISRGRNDYSPDLGNRLWMGTLLVEPTGFVMERKMLLGIKERAEFHWLPQPVWAH